MQKINIDKREKIVYNIKEKGVKHMLVDFKVSNYLSFDQLQIFSMEAGKVRNHSERLYITKKLKLLKFMAIYGANASGKSNLISAMEFAKSIIINGLSSDCANYFCKLSDNNKTLPSKFEFTIELNGSRFCYGFEVILNSLSFQAEWLRELTYGNKYKSIFERNIATGDHTVNTFFYDNSINERLSIYADDVRNDDSILFLTLMNQNKGSLYNNNEEIRIYQTIFNWFKQKLSVNSPDSPITNYTYLLNDDSIEKISKLLSAFSTGVSQFSLVSIPLEKVSNNVPKEIMKDISDHLMESKKQLDEKGISTAPAIMLRNSYDNAMFILELRDDGSLNAKTFQFNHCNTNAVFSLNEESDGTIRLLDLIEVLLCTDQESVYVIDEINRRFHPLLTYKFIEEYLKIAENHHIQLIVTTHESKIMDLNLLRKDEISFVNKNKQGQSEIFSLNKFGERFDKKICTAYLNGDYGAIPTF